MSSSSRSAFKFFEPGAEPAGIEEDSLRRARTAIDKLKRAYVSEWAPASLDELERALKIARSSPEMAAEQLDTAFRFAHDMKGQGATFGFMLISEIGAALCNLTFERTEATPAGYVAMLAHVAAARTVLAEELDDADSPAALELRADLMAAVRAHLH